MQGDGNVESVTLDDWNRIVAVNLTGAMLTAQFAERLMQKNPDGPTGSIIISSSMSAYRPMANFIAI